MANCKQSPQEFIKNAFTPQVAVLCTPSAEKCCSKNNLTFVQMLQPFSRLNSDVHCKDPNGVVNTIKNLKICFLDVNFVPPPPALARKLLNLAASEATDPRLQSISHGNRTLEIPSFTPWFEEWRNMFLKVQYPSDHEYTQHFLACLLVISSEDPIDTVDKLVLSLNQMQSYSPGQLPKWFSSNILKYFVVVHDMIDGVEHVACGIYDSLKNLYGSTNSFLLRMNSRPPGYIGKSENIADPWSQFINNNFKAQTDLLKDSNILEVGEEANELKTGINNVNSENYHPLSSNSIQMNNENLMNMNEKSNGEEDSLNDSSGHGCCLGSEDVENIKSLVYEFTKGCLIPYVEKQLQTLNENVSIKKGVSRSLFSATKRWFNPNKPGAASMALNNLMYASDSPELQVRKLGDLYFMFGNYNLAFNAFHLAKRDFSTDQAWLYYAGALEMAALSAFMGNESTKKTSDYIEEGITTYLNTCKMPQFATRATLLSTECLKNKFCYGDAAMQLIRMTSEESDLRSALLLEQAAYCFLKSKMFRKYAFHMVLAGHRYSKSAQKKHSLRSYKQAYQVFEGNGWNLACDHIHYTIGRQANGLMAYEEAVDSFCKLLLGESKQSPQQQSIFLKEYLTILENKLNSSNSTFLPILPIPRIDNSSLKILFEPPLPLKTPGRIPAMGMNFKDKINFAFEEKWNKLEEMLVQEVQGSVPIIFKPSVTYYNKTNLLKNSPKAIINEPIQLSIELTNLLQVVLYIRDIYLLWTFSRNGETVSNENNLLNVEKYIKTHVNESVVLQNGGKLDVILLLTPLVTGNLTIYGVCYSIGTSAASTTENFIKGKQLISIYDKPVGDETPKLVEITIVPAAPCLQVTFSEVNLDVLCDEIQQVTIDFHNTSSVPLHKIYMATSVPQMFCFVDIGRDKMDVEEFSDNESVTVKDKFARKNHITCIPLNENVLSPGKSTSITIWIKAPSARGQCLLDLLIYYENVDNKSIPRHRLVRQSWNLTVSDSVKFEVQMQPSLKSIKVEESNVLIKASNLNKTHDTVLTEVTLLNISLLSRYWIFIEENMSKHFNLNSQESTYILLKAKRATKTGSSLSSISLTINKSTIDNYRNIFIAFARKLKRDTLNVFDDSHFRNYKENKNGFVAIQWQAVITDVGKKRNILGHSQVHIEYKNQEHINRDSMMNSTMDVKNLLDSVNDKQIKDNKTNELNNQVIYNMLAYSVVKHNFSSKQICIVPVTLVLHNIVDNETINVIVRTITNHSLSNKSHNPNLYYSTATQNFQFVGPGTVRKQMEPLTSTTIKLSVAINQPGTYDLGSHIEILCEKMHLREPPAKQACQIHSTLFVMDTSST